MCTSLPTPRNTSRTECSRYRGLCLLPPSRSASRLILLNRPLCMLQSMCALSAPRSAPRFLLESVSSILLRSSTSLKHHLQLLNVISCLQEVTHQFSLVWFSFGSLRNTSQNLTANCLCDCDFIKFNWWEIQIQVC